MTLTAVIAATLLTAAAAAWRWRQAIPAGERLAALGLGLPSLFCIFFLVAVGVATAESDEWSFIRLAPSVAQSRGTPLYSPEGRGPLLGWSYGPVMPLANLPWGAFPDPSAALTAAGLTNAAVLLLPLLFAIWRAMPADAAHRAKGVLILAALHALMMLWAPSQYWLRRIQVDAFAMGLWLAGVAVLLGPDPRATPSRARLWGTALLVTLSAFSKHNESVLSAIPLAAAWAMHGRGVALRLALATAVLAGVGTLLCVTAWGWEAVYLNFWRVPANHPWAVTGAGGLVLAGRLFLDACEAALLVFLILAAADFFVRPRGGTLRDWLAERPWAIPAAAAILILPVSLVGRIKIGGDKNSFHSVYFMMAAAGMIVARWSSTGKPPALRRAVPIAAVLVAVVATAMADRGERPLDEQFRDSRLRKEYRFAREHPGEVWFGANPLVTLYTDGCIYHQGYGVYDRLLAQLPPTPLHLREYLPAKLRWVSSPEPPWWRPQEGFVRTAAPPGLRGTFWYERAPRD